MKIEKVKTNKRSGLSDILVVINSYRAWILLSYIGGKEKSNIFLHQIDIIGFVIFKLHGINFKATGLILVRQLI